MPITLGATPAPGGFLVTVDAMRGLGLYLIGLRHVVQAQRDCLSARAAARD